MPTFTIRNGKTAPAFEREGGDWEPQVHFTGESTNKDLVDAVQTIINNHVEGVVAHYDYNPFHGMFSVELQFDDEEKAKACRKEYASLFTKGGKLKKKRQT